MKKRVSEIRKMIVAAALGLLAAGALPAAARAGVVGRGSSQAAVQPAQTSQEAVQGGQEQTQAQEGQGTVQPAQDGQQQVQNGQQPAQDGQQPAQDTQQPVQQPGQSGLEQAGLENSATGRGTQPTQPGDSQPVNEVWQDTEAPAPTLAYGYTRDDAVRVAEQLYSYVQDPQKKEICVSFLLNSIWYDPANIMRTDSGMPLLCIYRGSQQNYERSYLLALDGLEFFANPTVLFLRNQEGELMLCVSTGSRFSEAQAAANYQTVLGFLSEISAVQAMTAGRDEADRAKIICDYVADKLSYDSTYGRNSLADALRSGNTACVGYNNLTELLFEHCGLPYVSVVGSEKGGNMEHIFGMSRIGSTWLVFDPTNYDRDDHKEPFWIFSDQYREGQFYDNFKLVDRIY